MSFSPQKIDKLILFSAALASAFFAAAVLNMFLVSFQYDWVEETFAQNEAMWLAKFSHPIVALICYLAAFRSFHLKKLNFLLISTVAFNAALILAIIGEQFFTQYFKPLSQPNFLPMLGFSFVAGNIISLTVMSCSKLVSIFLTNVVLKKTR